MWSLNGVLVLANHNIRFWCKSNSIGRITCRAGTAFTRFFVMQLVPRSTPYCVLWAVVFPCCFAVPCRCFGASVLLRFCASVACKPPRARTAGKLEASPPPLLFDSPGGLCDICAHYVVVGPYWRSLPRACPPIVCCAADAGAAPDAIREGARVLAEAADWETSTSTYRQGH